VPPIANEENKEDEIYVKVADEEKRSDCLHLVVGANVSKLAGENVLSEASVIAGWKVILDDR